MALEKASWMGRMHICCVESRCQTLLSAQ